MRRAAQRLLERAGKMRRRKLDLSRQHLDRQARIQRRVDQLEHAPLGHRRQSPAHRHRARLDDAGVTHQQMAEPGRDGFDEGQPTRIATVRFVSERQHEMPDLRRPDRVGAPQAHGLDGIERRRHQARQVQWIERHAQISQRAVEPQRDGHRAGTDPETLRRNRELLESVRLLDLELERCPVEVER